MHDGEDGVFFLLRDFYGWDTVEISCREEQETVTRLTMYPGLLLRHIQSSLSHVQRGIPSRMNAGETAP